MDNKVRCQSCGQPISETNFGTNSDGSFSREFCNFCYQNGSFTDSVMTKEKMIQLSIDNMTKELGIPEDKAKELAETVIPQLSRWKEQ